MSEQADRTRLVCLGLAAAVCLAYAYTLRCSFVGLDDGPYVVENTRIQVGTWAERIFWAFTAFHSSNWHPLTWLSHALDFQLFGLNPAGHHLTNVLLHAANTVLLFLALGRLTGAFWRSAATAGLFGLHPLQVESVAWVASRKGLLAAFFAFLGLLAYERYCRRPAARTWLPVCLCLALSLLAKQSFVIFPALLLLLDWWPLQRVGVAPPARAWSRLMSEKLPLLALAGFASWLTLLAQRHGGAVAPLGDWGLVPRLVYGLAAYAGYLAQTVYPHDLALLYPLSQSLPWAKAALGALLLVAGCWLAYAQRFRAPYLATGWLWCILALLPVAGLVQIGNQAMADRYMYVPLVGLGIIVCWGAPELLRAATRRTQLLAAGCVLLALLLGAASYRQTLWWKDAVTLYSRTIAVTSDNYFIERVMAMELRKRGEFDRAVLHYRNTLRINPRFQRAYHELGFLLFGQKRYAEAAELYEQALARWPDDYEFRYNCGASYAQLGRLPEAAAQFEAILGKNSDDAAAQRSLKILREDMARRKTP